MKMYETTPQNGFSTLPGSALPDPFRPSRREHGIQLASGGGIGNACQDKIVRDELVRRHRKKGLQEGNRDELGGWCARYCERNSIVTRSAATRVL